ncbi:MAG TPA: alpha/beta hydrolase [Gammaproteobacteria bacterium]|nr:alpha/beta hydrolase [Gammaproteobacteria bacterium]
MNVHTIAGGGGLNLHVREWGNPAGLTILLVHGWSQSHLCWQRQLESTLAEDFRLVALDNRGHGMSDSPAAVECYTDSHLWADDVAAIIAALELERPVLVGWSYGGLIISDYVRHYGEEGIAATNFAGAATVLNEKAFGTLIGPGFLENFEGSTSTDMPTNIEAIKRFLHACFEVPLPRSDFETALAYNMMVAPEVRLHLGSRDLDNTDILERLTVPVLVSHGRRDTVVLPAAGEYILEHCKTAESSWYDNIGHAPFLEDAGRFNDELADFTRRCRA